MTLPFDKTDNYILRAAEEMYGIKADPDDAARLHAHIVKKYKGADQGAVKKIFASGEAARFLTVNETYFFREPAQFFLLRDFLLSAGSFFAEGLGRGLRVCCAAVASGCEAYSVAMLLDARGKSASNPFPFHIDAFDINPGALEIAREGVYTERALREDGSCFHDIARLYLKKREGEGRAEYAVDASLKKNIRFFSHNLMDELPFEFYDLVFFRNAFIYITAKNRSRVLSNLRDALKEGGILITGISETSAVRHNGLEAKNWGDVFYFQKNSL